MISASPIHNAYHTSLHRNNVCNARFQTDQPIKLKTNKLPGQPSDEKNKDHEVRATNVFHTTDFATTAMFSYTEETKKRPTKGTLASGTRQRIGENNLNRQG